jgi:hypothetical protein
MKWWTCLPLALPLLLAPGVRAQEGKMPTSPWFPLAVGTTWVYKSGDSRFSLRVARHEKVDNVLCARVELLVDGKPTSYEHIGVTADGLYRYDFEGQEARPPIRFLKLPPGRGDTWAVDSAIGKEKERLKGTFKTGEVDKFKVPAGTYPKVVTSSGQDLDANGMKLSVTYYFAEKVGVVKQVIDVAGQKIVIELEKFQPPAAR